MAAETSLWSRTHCYLTESEASRYDVSLRVAGILDTGALPCVDVYEPPTVDQFHCDENGIKGLTDPDPYEKCRWGGVARSTDDFYGDTRAPSPLPGPSTAPAPSTPRDVTPQPGITSTDSSYPPPAEEGVSCAVGSTCQDDVCCHPNTNTCGRSELRRAMLPDAWKCEHGLLTGVLLSLIHI